MPSPRPPAGAIFNPNSHYYEVVFARAENGLLMQPVYAMGIVAAYNIALGSLPESERQYILYCKSVTRIDEGE